MSDSTTQDSVQNEKTTQPIKQDDSFPWYLGVYDSHCHPTDTMSSIESIPSMKTRVLTVMATRSQDQELVQSTAQKYAVRSSDPEKWSREECVVPCFGWHPWFSHQMYIDNGEQPKHKENADHNREREEIGALTGPAKIRHYQNVLRPQRSDPSDEDIRIFSSLPDPKPFSEFLSQTRKHIESFPFALIGEIGLDRSFRIPEAWEPSVEAQRHDQLTRGGREGRRLTPFRVDLGHQNKIFSMQLQLAADLGVGVSVHGVQAHGMVYEVVKEFWRGHEKQVLSRREQKKQKKEAVQEAEPQNPAKEGTRGTRIGQKSQDEDSTGEKTKSFPYPPRICLHSYSGNPSSFKQFLDPSIPCQIFASFSTAINLGDALDEEMPASFEEMVKSVPDHMLLVESDLHVAGDRMDEKIENIVRRICQVKGWELEGGVRRLGENWQRFVFG